MNVFIKGMKIFGYAGYLNPKTPLAKECVLYHLASLSLSIVFFSVLFVNDTDPLIASASGVALAMIVFVALFKLNNLFFARDKALLENLVVTGKIDTIDLLTAFSHDIRLTSQVSTERDFNPDTAVDLHGKGISHLFQKLFREHADQLYRRFNAQGRDLFMFVCSLDPQQRELLFRYYLHRTSCGAAR